MHRIRQTQILGLLLIAASWVAARRRADRQSAPRPDNAPGERRHAPATPPADNVPSIGELMNVLEKATAQKPEGTDWGTPVKLVIIFAGLALLPSLLVMMTSFTRIVIVLSFVRRALTTQSIPPTIAMIGLAMFLTLYTMAPTYARVNAEAIQPYLADQIALTVAVAKAGDCLKEFMLRQSRKSDLALFVQMAKAPAPATADGHPAAHRGAGVHHQRVPHGVRDRVPAVHPVPADRHGDRQRAAQRGHDDAAAGDDLAAVQADPVHPRGRLGPAGQESESGIPIRRRCGKGDGSAIRPVGPIGPIGPLNTEPAREPRAYG